MYLSHFSMTFKSEIEEKLALKSKFKFKSTSMYNFSSS